MTSPHQQQSQIPSENETLIASFMDITSSTIEEARFYLESHNFDLDSAVGTFFDSPAVAPPTAVASPTAVTTAVDSLSHSSPSAGGGSPSRSNSPPPAIDSQYNIRSRRTGDDNTNRTRSGRIRTFSDINQGGDGSDSDPDRPPQYFTGGEKSGILVQDPSKVDDVDALFKQARQMGAMEGPAAFQPSSSSRSFTGTARLLSGEVVPSASQERPPGSVTHTITFWRNGFTVDDGPLRRFQDPENAAFLERIKKSECPEELQPADRRTSVNVNLVRKDQTCLEPKKHKVAFHGVARTLGNSSSSIPSGPTIDSTTPLNTAPAPVMGLVVDQNSPTTSIQLRLSDGTRMVSRFNYHHTIRDIHSFINASRPGSTGTCTLQTMGFPPTKLTDLEQTIDQAGLANSVIIQKF